MSKKILVIGEAADGTLRNVSFETIATAKKMQADAEIVAVVLGKEGTQAHAEEMIKYGADRAITVEHDNLENYTSEGYGQALLEVIEEESPYGVVMGHTAIGKDVTPKIASRLESGLISDVVDVELDGDTSCVGGISGYNTANAVIENCRNTGYIYGKGKLVGGICGYSFGEIKKCYNKYHG